MLFLLYNSDLPMILDNILVGFADDSTLIAALSKPGRKVPAEVSIFRELACIGDWYGR